LVDLHTGEVVWFNVLQAGTQIAGINMGDIRKPEGAAQMVDRLLDRMKPVKAVRQRMKETQLMCANCLALSRRAMLAGSGALAATLATGAAQARISPNAMTPLIGLDTSPPTATKSASGS
jgi:hypothetical protein